MPLGCGGIVDKKDKAQVVGGMQRLAAGALGVGVTLATKDPMAGMAASAAAMTATDYMKSKLSGDSGELATAEATVLFDYCARLDGRLSVIETHLLESGQKPDRQDLLSKEVTFSRFARGLGEAATVEKREALVHATAYQFDPRKGSPATRDYWLRQVRELPESDLAFINLVATHRITFFKDDLVVLPTADEILDSDLKPFMSREDAVAFTVIAGQMTRRGFEGFVRNGERVQIRFSTGIGVGHLETFVLTAAGATLRSFCSGE